MAKKKKKQGLSPTFKAGLVVIIALGIMWAGMTLNEPWYQDTQETTNAPAPVSMAAEQTTAAPVTEAPTTEAPTTEAPTEAETTTQAPAIQLPPADWMNDNFDYTMNPHDFEDRKLFWSFRRNSEHKPVEGYSEGVDIAFFDAFYIVPTEEKVVYLTFDEGYENGFTPTILDTLKAHNVQAAFFVTAPYIKNESVLVTRMKEEGHVVANHSVHHYDGSSGDGTALYDISSEAMVAELSGVASLMKEKTGFPIDRFFRPPGGLFNERTLYITRQQGYKTIFWSMAYADWYVDKQPGKEVAYKHVMDNVHPGAIILLHAVSQSNTEALDDILKDLKAQGYRFGSLYEIDSKYDIQ